MMVAVDRTDARFLPSATRDCCGGRRPRDVPRLTIPKAGQRATFYGAYGA
jgi:hypothetical protein